MFEKLEGENNSEINNAAFLEREAIEAAEESCSKLSGTRKMIIGCLLGVSAVVGGPIADYIIQGEKSPFINEPGIHEIYLAQNPEVKYSEQVLESRGIPDYEYFDHYHLTKQEIEFVAKEVPHVGEVEVLRALEDVGIKNTIERSKRMANFQEHVQGIETFKNSSASEVVPLLRDVIHRTLPRGLVFNIDQLKYNPSAGRPRDSYGAKLATESVEVAKEMDHIITFVGGSDSESAESKLFDFFHEIFHANDWKENRLLTRTERLELLDEVIDRVNAKDRYQSGYVETIVNKDKQREMGIKCGEYFAEIGRAYLEGLPLPQKDAKIIQSVIQKTDPDFNVTAAHYSQMSLLKKYQHEK